MNSPSEISDPRAEIRQKEGLFRQPFFITGFLYPSNSLIFRNRATARKMQGSGGRKAPITSRVRKNC